LKRAILDPLIKGRCGLQLTVDQGLSGGSQLLTDKVKRKRWLGRSDLHVV